MANPFNNEARRDHGDKLARMTGQRGEYPPDRAARIGHAKLASTPGIADYKRTELGDAAQEPAEVFVGAPARQVSNYGKVRK